MSTDKILDFAFEASSPSIIKVVGVGGGGGNAVTHMYKQGIHDVSFALCNTDSQALKDSPVAVKLQLGEGLGAGNKPEKAKLAAEESLEEIKQLLDDGTKMVFITAGMGGGTGTGAAPVIAKAAKELAILTIGIVTIPFAFEGKRKILKALEGVEEMSKYVDALLVVNNERLREIYSDLSAPNAFAKADDTLTIAAKGIAEIITLPGIINLDFADVYTTLKDGGVAIMSTGYGEGKNRVAKAIESALNSPLLNNNDVFNSKKLLFNIYFGDDELMTYELDDFDNFTSQFDPDVVDVIWGMAHESGLGDSVKVTVLASGFDFSNMPEQLTQKTEQRKITYPQNNSKNDPLTPSGNADQVIEKWYPKSSDPLILTWEQLNFDEELIAEMDATPSFLRNAKTSVRSAYQSKAQNRGISRPSPAKPEDDGVIRF
ncbi:MAG: cell division protein FtsZ [Candidatus Azobacteroides sp.]|nr:cell division protein FtsZ [Candidatus Azobacteroides sp.]